VVDVMENKSKVLKYLNISHSSFYYISLLDQSEALLNALQKETPMIIHSDQGSEYKSKLFRKILEDFNIHQSMSKKGSPWQNGYHLKCPQSNLEKNLPKKKKSNTMKTKRN